MPCLAERNPRTTARAGQTWRSQSISESQSRMRSGHTWRSIERQKTETLMTLISTLRERRSWAILQHPIDVQVDVLVVETEQVFNLRALGNWRRITPHDILDELVAHPSRPVARHSLIRQRVTYSEGSSRSMRT